MRLRLRTKACCQSARTNRQYRICILLGNYPESVAFTGGALKGNLKLAESRHQQSLIAYRQTIPLAFGEVSDALIGYQKLHEVRVRQEDTVADLQESSPQSQAHLRKRPFSRSPVDERNQIR